MISNSEIILRLVLGALFGGIIGYERQVHGRPAGFRTHMLVCIASVLIMEVSEYFHYLGTMDPSYVRVDPGRIASGAITGIGFLGAGVIVKMGATVQGLTTAACLWIVSAIGLALGTGLYYPSSVAFGMTLFALLVLRYVEKATPKLVFKFLRVAGTGSLTESSVRTVIESCGASVHTTDYEKDNSTGDVVFSYAISVSTTIHMGNIVEALTSEQGVTKVSLRS